MNKKGFLMENLMPIIFILTLGFLFLTLTSLFITDSKSVENREEFCLMEGMRLSNDGDYCFDGFEKMYWIEATGHEWFLFYKDTIETDFKLVKEVVTLE